MMPRYTSLHGRCSGKLRADSRLEPAANALTRQPVTASIGDASALPKRDAIRRVVPVAQIDAQTLDDRREARMNVTFYTRILPGAIVVFAMAVSAGCKPADKAGGPANADSAA